MELNIRIPDHTAAIFDYLQKGQFISSNSTNEDIRNLYDMIDDDFEALSVYFAQIGYTLERGNEYFYFSRIEPRVTLEQKILRAYYWIDVLDLFKTYDETFGPGHRFPARADIGRSKHQRDATKQAGRHPQTFLRQGCTQGSAG